MVAVPPTPPPFVVHVERIARADLPYSWHPGCPVAPSGLRRLRLSFVGFDGKRHIGQLVVNANVVPQVTVVFRTLYRARFPIRRMHPIDAYEGSDDRSAAADNTSSFNCRPAVSTGPRSWSMHAYGEAIDVNDVENPYIFGSRVIPPAGRAYRDRANVRRGMAVEGGTLVRAFTSVGWGWGARFSSPDYQHFSVNGR
jgi:D-alanyl-D-alanine carboxypeptidase-like protein